MKYILFFLVFSFFSCNTKKGQEVNSTKNSIKSKTDILKTRIDSIKPKEIKSLVLATIDSFSIEEIKHFSESKSNIFNYYLIENQDEVEIWSEKMFGRCCTEADLLYSNLLSFNISANIENAKYPIKNLSDASYLKTYAFKETDTLDIYLKLDKNEDHFYHTEHTLDEVLKSTDTILNPFRLSLVNGYVKSEKTFTENGRVKTINVFMDNVFINTVKLLDTPLIQEFKVNAVFTKDSSVKLVPVSYYKGSKYTDVCISEIQSSLTHITHPSLNKKYKINTLFNYKLSQREN
ncbi:hypothetical protein [Aurantibacter sp.]|uniref:NADase-type glycan-binding domain-containing protein n=1 Tax=Aurantibacter sp. TaxID=2807103 RepID=UPI0035C7EFFC